MKAASLRGVELRWDMRIPMRDGVELSATLYTPREHESASPAIVTMTPYIAQSCHDVGMYFAEHGFPFLVADVRGRGNSQGGFHPLNEARDGHDIVEWLARQPYCNGRVAMWGGSYAGYAQWATVKERPPHLSTLVPVASPYRGVDSPVRNNIFEPYTVQWLTLLAGRTSQEKIFADAAFWNGRFRECVESGKPFREIDAQLGNPSALFQEWLAHPHQDAYWDAYNPRPEDCAWLSIPVLTITGSYDGNQAGALAHYRAHMKYATPAARNEHYLVIGPWDHAGTRTPSVRFGGLELGPASLVDLGRLHRQWYAWTMQDGAKPEFLQKNVAYYVTGAEEWRYADTLDEITSRSDPLYLRSTRNPVDVFQSGSLEPKAQGCSGGPDCYVYDPRDTSRAALEACRDRDDLRDQSRVLACGGQQLVYHSAPFDDDVEISGFFRLSLWVAIDQPDTDFRATVYAIETDGSSLRLTSDSLRARYRESLREPRLIDTLEPLRYDFTRFMFVSRLMRKGSRLRLVVGPIDSIHSQRNYNAGGVAAEESVEESRAVTVRVFHDEARPSVLVVPIGKD
jgi:putative CocE/NonD family hydrolase